MRFLPLALFLPVLLLSAGCGGGKSSVSGTVTFDGKPLPEGQIAFVPASGKDKGANATIKDGAYSLQVPSGDYAVQVTASKKMPLPAGKTGMFGAKEEVRQYIPERYNAKTELKAKVPASGSLDFALKPK